MTAVEWLEKEFIKLESTIGVHGKMYELIEQAKQMETEQQQKMVDDALTNYELGWADRKTSSQTEISDINEKIKSIYDEYSLVEVDSSLISKTFYNGIEKGYKKCLEDMSQTEISDEEIEAQALTFAKEESYGELNSDLWKGYVFGAKRMREQLKSK